MDKTPIQKAIEIMEAKMDKFTHPDSSIKGNIKLSFFNAKQELEKLLPYEKQAMDEARIDAAIGFARFIDSGAFECILHTDDDEKIWQEYGEGTNYTTSELYNLYLKNKEK